MVVAGVKQRLAEQQDGVVVSPGVRVFLDDVEEDRSRLVVVLQAEEDLRVQNPAIRDVRRRGWCLLELQHGHEDPLVELDELFRVIVDFVGPSGRTEETRPAERERGD